MMGLDRRGIGVPAGFCKASTVKRIALIYVAILFAAEIMVTAYYLPYGVERLVFELTMTAIIATVISIPIVTYLVWQNDRLKSLSDELRVLNSTDPMTGLLNRKTFLDCLQARIDTTGDGSSAGVFLFLDADHFKRINDRFGHSIGDKVLVFLGDVLRSETRAHDLAGRLGGEEFGVFLSGAPLDQAAAAAERIRRRAEEAEILLPSLECRFSVSIGLASHRPGMAGEAVMNEADRSLYAAKQAGRNAVVVEMRRNLAA